MVDLPRGGPRSLAASLLVGLAWVVQLNETAQMRAINPRGRRFIALSERPVVLNPHFEKDIFVCGHFQQSSCFARGHIDPQFWIGGSNYSIRCGNVTLE